MKDKAIDEYTYVDPHKCRYEMSLEALDLSTSDRVIYANSELFCTFSIHHAKEVCPYRDFWPGGVFSIT